MRYVIAIAALLISLNLDANRPAVAEGIFGRTFNGSVSLQTPVGMSPQHTSEDTPQVLWRLNLPNVVEKFSLWTSGQIGFKAGTPWDAENKLQFGVEHPLGYGLTAYAAFERRQDLDENRYFVGCRWNFGGRY